MPHLADPTARDRGDHGGVVARAHGAGVPLDLARAVARGLAASPKQLPAWLFYDQRGSALFEAITRLPEYYLTRAEAEIFDAAGGDIVGAGMRDRDTTIFELGAGTATKTQSLLRAAAARHGGVTYVPIDVSPSALEAAQARLAAEEPAIRVQPWVLHHDDAFPRIARTRGRKLVLFIGSSIGNYEEDEAATLLGGVRRALGEGDALLLGTDLRKDPAVLVRAYDDAAGVTAAFNRNLLVRINRELGGGFDVDRFRHVARWDEPRSRIEMHLESIGAQTVAIERLGLIVRFADGERIHTESSHKYDDARVDRLLGSAGFRRDRTWHDAGRRFAVHLTRAVTS